MHISTLFPIIQKVIVNENLRYQNQRYAKPFRLFFGSTADIILNGSYALADLICKYIHRRYVSLSDVYPSC